MRPDAVVQFVEERGGVFPAQVKHRVADVAKHGATPLVVAQGPRVLGIVQLKDVVKGGISERFAEMRRIGIRTVMITGDNPLTAAAIAAEAGVDDSPCRGHTRSQIGDDSRLPTKGSPGSDDWRRHQRRASACPSRRGCRHEHRHTGRQRSGQHGRSRLQSDQTARHRRNREANAHDARCFDNLQYRQRLAKYFAIIPAAFVTTYPALGAPQRHGLTFADQRRLERGHLQRLDHRRAHSVERFAVVKYRPSAAPVLLRRNIVVYGLGGLLLPFPGIKLIDVVLTAVGVS